MKRIFNNGFFDAFRRGMGREPEDDPLMVASDTSMRTRSKALLCELYRTHWKPLTTGVLTVALIVLLQIPMPWITRHLIDDVLIRHSTDTLVFLTAAIAVLFAGRSILSRWTSYHFHVMQTRLTAALQKRLIGRVFRLPMALYDKTATGYLMSRISGDSHGVSWFFSQGLVRVAADLFRMLISIGIVFTLEYRLGLVVVLGLPVMMFLSGFWAKRARNMSLFNMETHARFLSGLQESVVNMPLIRTFAAEQKMEQQLGSGVEQLSDLSIENHAVQSISDTTLNAVPMAIRLLVLIGGGVLVFQDIWSIGDLYAYQAYIAWIIGPAMAVAHYRIQYERAATSLDRVGTLLAVSPENQHENGIVVDKLRGDIEFTDVCFSYDNHHRVIDNFSAAIPAGTHVAVTGVSGIGKSTLISLILGFYEPLSGTVTIDGRPVHAYDTQSLRKRIGVVPQKTALLRSTIRENICLGYPEASLNALENVIKKACLDSFIAGLPNGVETVLTESGENLSEGQRQRIAIARALLIDPDILILDEPFSALDTQNAEQIMENILAHCRGKTVLIVSHRVSHLRECCLTIRMEDTAGVVK